MRLEPVHFAILFMAPAAFFLAAWIRASIIDGSFKDLKNYLLILVTIRVAKMMIWAIKLDKNSITWKCVCKPLFLLAVTVRNLNRMSRWNRE